jgi:ubiquinone/menaquinone biosynthesis C-methylase UbiE
VEIGTGRRGLGARVAVERLGATEVTAVDLYPATVGRARLRCADLADRVTFRVGDATALPVDDASATSSSTSTRCTTSPTGGPPSPRPRGCCGPAGSWR